MTRIIAKTALYGVIALVVFLIVMGLCSFNGWIPLEWWQWLLWGIATIIIVPAISFLLLWLDLDTERALDKREGRTVVPIRNKQVG